MIIDEDFLPLFAFFIQSRWICHILKLFNFNRFFHLSMKVKFIRKKTSIALSYRLALNSLIRNETESLKSNLLILDEPTDGFSRSQLEKMRDVLQDMNSKQIILVSHENVLESCSNTIFKVSKTNGISEIISDDGIN